MQARDPVPGNGARGSGEVPRVDIPGPHRAGPGQPAPAPVAAATDYSPRPGPSGPSSGEYPRVSDYPLPPRPGGPGGEGLRLEPPSGAPRRRLPELVLGIFLVAGCALAAVLLAAAGRDRTPALALVGDVQRGDVISDGDLNTIYIGTDPGLAYLDPDDAGQVIGRAALANLPAGTLITADQFAHPDSVLSSGDAAIGLALEAGQLPSLSLAPGDRVKVVAGGAAGSQDQPLVIESATVESVTEIQGEAGQQARWRVSLRLSENDATNLAMALASNAQIQLVMVER
jgi:hypothetical protein